MLDLRAAAAAALLALTLTSPSAASRHTAIEPLLGLEVAAAELAALDALTVGIYDPRLRREMVTRIRSAELAVHQARYALHFGADPGPDLLSFDDARALITREHFDADKVEVMARIAPSARFTTDEARALAALCTFDGGRRDALIALFPSVTDKARYALALDILTFGSSKHEVIAALGI